MGPAERFMVRSLRKRLRELIFILQVFGSSALFAAPPILRCEIHQGGEVYIADFMPGTDPYSIEATNINERFRFKAVVIGNKEDIEYIKIYTYYTEERQVILLHEVKYLPPFRQSEPSFAALTGVNYLYAPLLERELQYGCAFLEARP
jgi:hypothetical protein